MSEKKGRIQEFIGRVKRAIFGAGISIKKDSIEEIIIEQPREAEKLIEEEIEDIDFPTDKEIEDIVFEEFDFDEDIEEEYEEVKEKEKVEFKDTRFGRIVKQLQKKHKISEKKAIERARDLLKVPEEDYDEINRYDREVLVDFGY